MKKKKATLIPKTEAKVLVVGSLGRYGKWLTEHLKFHSFHYCAKPKGFDVKDPKGGHYFHLRTLLGWADIIILSVPYHEVVHTLELLGGFLRKDQLVIDISSKKMEIHEAIKVHKADFALIHPLCKPPEDQLNLKGFQVIEVSRRIRNDRCRKWYKEFLSVLAGSVYKMSLQQHLMWVEIPTKVIHAALYSATATLKELGVPIDKVRLHASPVSEIFLSATERHFSGIGHWTFVDIQKSSSKDEISQRANKEMIHRLKGLKHPISVVGRDLVAFDWDDTRKYLLGLDK